MQLRAHRYIAPILLYLVSVSSAVCGQSALRWWGWQTTSTTSIRTLHQNAATEPVPGVTLAQVATAVNGLATLMQQLAANTQTAQQTAEAAGTEAQQANVTVANDAARAKFKPLRPEKFTGDGQPTVADWCDSMDDYLMATGLVNTR